ncbi:unnamed protein product, partial [Chrysoparadoxa australica]
KRPKCGQVTIVSGMEPALRIVNELSDANDWITDVKFSPNGNTMAASSMDKCVYIYDVMENFQLKVAAEGAPGPITNINFSASGDWIRASTSGTDCPTVFINASTGEINENGAELLKDELWATWTSPTGRQSQGAWPASAESCEEVAACDRSVDGSLLSACLADGELRLLKYPAVGTTGVAYKSLPGHAPGGGNIRFCSDDNTIISVGAVDRCVFQWNRVRSSSTNGEQKLIDLGQYDLDTEVPESSPPPAGCDASLQYVHGCSNLRNSIGLTAGGEVVFPTGSIGVVYDQITNLQRFQQSHSAAITSLSTSPCGGFVATGDAESRIAVWSTTTAKLLKELPIRHRGHVTGLSFSADGKRLASIGGDDDHSLVVWASPSGSWLDAAPIAWGAGARELTLFVAWTNHSKNEIMTGGVGFVTFWSLRPNLSSIKVALSEPILCAAALGGAMLAGTYTGELLVWDSLDVTGPNTKAIPAHQGPVNSIIATHSGGLATGGRDGLLKIWDGNVTEKQEIAVGSAITGLATDRLELLAVASVAEGAIYEAVLDSGATTLLLRGNESQISSLAVSASGSIASAGGDLSLWDSSDVWENSRHPYPHTVWSPPEYLRGDRAVVAVAWAPHASCSDPSLSSVLALCLGSGLVMTASLSSVTDSSTGHGCNRLQVEVTGKAEGCEPIKCIEWGTEGVTVWEQGGGVKQ